MVEQSKVIREATTPRCLWCGSDRRREWLTGVRDRLRHVGGSWDYDCCCDCGAGILQPMPDPGWLATLYPPGYCAAAAPDNKGIGAPLLARLELAALYRALYEFDLRRLRMTGLAAGHRLLDLGCGSGHRMALLARRQVICEGLDIDPSNVAYVSRHLRLPARLGLAEMAEYPAGAFDAVSAFALMEHVSAPLVVAERVHGWLKRGGVFVFTVPLADSPQCRVLGTDWSAVTEAPRHLSLPSCRGIEALCRKAGFGRTTVVSGSLLDNAGIVALSLVPQSSAALVYNYGPVRKAVRRLAGMVAASLALPAVTFELLFSQSGLAFVVAQK